MVKIVSIIHNDIIYLDREITSNKVIDVKYFTYFVHHPFRMAPTCRAPALDRRLFSFLLVVVAAAAVRRRRYGISINGVYF
jgi:hypothetical protein